MVGLDKERAVTRRGVLGDGLYLKEDRDHDHRSEMDVRRRLKLPSTRPGAPRERRKGAIKV